MPIIQSLKSFFTQSVRVWHVLRKPSKEEWTTVAKVSAIGILVIGAVGFLISVLITFFKSFSL